MIRPVLYVDLPGIIYALDRRARLLGRSLATFVCAPEYQETHSGVVAALRNLMPVHATARTWICEEHWHLMGVAQARSRETSWELVYLASLAGQLAQTHDILRELLEYATNAAIMSGTQRIFARTDEDADTLTLFQRVGFQRYAREMLYVRPSPIVDAAAPALRPLGVPEVVPRRWHPHDAWGLMRLHDLVTPRKVQFAENLSSDELLHQLVPSERQWHIPGLEPRDERYVLDLGSRLAGWVRLRQSWAGLPHQIWLKIHPEHCEMAPALIQFALQRLSTGDAFAGNRLLQAPVICHVRDYDGATIDALRNAKFEHVSTKAILVRHLTLSAYNERIIPGLAEARVNYGVKGIGSIGSTVLPLMREEDSCNYRSPMTSTSCSQRSRRPLPRPSGAKRNAQRSSKSSWTSVVPPRPVSLMER